MPFSGSSKLQIPTSREAPTAKLPNDRCGAGMFEIWSLEFLWSLELGFWSFFMPRSSCLRLFFASTPRDSRPVVPRHRFLRRDGHAGTNALQPVDHDLFVRFQAGANDAFA